jgi:hypothetical protein
VNDNSAADLTGITEARRWGIRRRGAQQANVGRAREGVDQTRRSPMKVRTGIKAGGLSVNHNEAQGGLKVHTGIKAGGFGLNHNEAQGGLKVQTGIKAGG